MKQIFLLLILFLALLACSPNKKFMSVDEAQKRWGLSTFTKEAFKSGTIKEKASVVVDLIKSGKYIGKPVEDVILDLGKPTGYYWNHNIPAYLVEEGSLPNGELKMQGDTWQIIFLPDKNGKIKEIKIHKNNSLE